MISTVNQGWPQTRVQYQGSRQSQVILGIQVPHRLNGGTFLSRAELEDVLLRPGYTDGRTAPTPMQPKLQLAVAQEDHQPTPASAPATSKLLILSCTPSSIWASHKAPLPQQWAKLTDLQRCQVPASAPLCPLPVLPSLNSMPSPNRWQSTLVPALRTNVCNLGTCCAHFDPDKEPCERRKVQFREHFYLLCPLYAASCAALLSDAQLSL